jgi:hypothetical protein
MARMRKNAPTLLLRSDLGIDSEFVSELWKGVKGSDIIVFLYTKI